MNRRPQVLLVDSEPGIRDLVEAVARRRDLQVAHLASLRDLFKTESLGWRVLLITGEQSRELADWVLHGIPQPWVVPMIPKGDVGAAVRAMKNGAMEVLQKPLDRRELLRVVDVFLREATGTEARLDRGLTPMEDRIMRLLVDGKSNRQIAAALTRSVRTVEVHRSRIMSKLGARNLVDLVNMASQEV